jgi:hypothetical protein
MGSVALSRNTLRWFLLAFCMSPLGFAGQSDGPTTCAGPIPANPIPDSPSFFGIALILLAAFGPKRFPSLG